MSKADDSKQHRSSKMSTWQNAGSRISFVHVMYPYPHALYSFMYPFRNTWRQSSPSRQKEIVIRPIITFRALLHSKVQPNQSFLQPVMPSVNRNTNAHALTCRPTPSRCMVCNERSRIRVGSRCHVIPSVFELRLPSYVCVLARTPKRDAHGKVCRG